MTLADARPLSFPQPTDHEAAHVDAAPVDASRAGWLRRYAASLVAVDLAALLMAATLASVLRFGPTSGASVRGFAYVGFGLLLAPAWAACLALSRCYETRFLGVGPEEFKRCFNASLRFVAVVTFAAYVTRTDLSRLYYAAAMLLGITFLLLGRYAARAWMHRQRRRGRCQHRVVVVGTRESAQHLAEQLQREPLAAYQVVAACAPGGNGVFLFDECVVPVLGSLDEVVDVLHLVKADSVAVAPGHALTSEALRLLSYELEGTGVDLLVSPTLTNITGTRISIRPVAGLPLLHVEEPELTGARKVVKTLFDRLGAATLLLLLSPLLLGLALAVRLTSRGPAFFSQTRIGRDGRPFRMWKLRSMHVGAEQQLAGLAASHDRNGHVLFKLAGDPRVTGIGRLMRKYSLDELPQLLNVLTGSMSLVGPRPPLPSEVAAYETHTHRRLMVKPGMTGLWQVSGRADLDWDETVRLDLHYVENWSLGLDLVVLAKTVLAVVRPSGAY